MKFSNADSLTVSFFEVPSIKQKNYFQIFFSSQLLINSISKLRWSKQRKRRKKGENKEGKTEIKKRCHNKFQTQMIFDAGKKMDISIIIDALSLSLCAHFSLSILSHTLFSKFFFLSRHLIKSLKQHNWRVCAARERTFFFFFSSFVYSLSDFADTSDRYEDLLARVWHLWLVVIGGVSREVNLVFRSARDQVRQVGRVHSALLVH